MYGYESSVTLITDRLHYKLQTHPLLREGTPRRRAKQLSGKRKEKEKSDHGPQRGALHHRSQHQYQLSKERIQKKIFIPKSKYVYLPALVNI
jgi:hypothetical protein